MMMNEYVHLRLHRERAARFQAEAAADRMAREVVRAKKRRVRNDATGTRTTTPVRVPQQRTGAEPAGESAPSGTPEADASAEPAASFRCAT